ncbi:MAG: SUMF1/EgtB/PvdO family nonheme iron enzyme [Phycisphaerae bacterium]|nr:SUMF1/EgtB/PvdO family nonheme iron enzyme [Phycisphaerae bacterium]
MVQDRYSQWLGIEEGARPPDHYALLGIEPFCNDADVIDTAAHQRLDLLDRYSLAGSRESRDTCQEMMNEVARARVVLMNPDRREEYNRQLGGQVATEPELPDVDQAVPSQEVLDFYKETVWAHLRKWQMDVHEERLLIAEAASLGINAETALIIARRINSQAEHLARSKQMRTAFGAILAACVVLTGVVLFFMFPPYSTNSQPEPEDILTGDVRSKPPVVFRRPVPPPEPTTKKVEDIEVAGVDPPKPAARAKVENPAIPQTRPIAIDVPKPKPESQPKPPPHIATTIPAIPIPTARDWPFDPAQAKARREASAREYRIPSKLVLNLSTSQNLTLILIPPGEFLMGSPPGEKSREKDEQLHAVNISRPFYIGITEVTQAQWKTVMSSSPWSGRAYGRIGATYPASHIDWEGAEDFCGWVSQKTGRKVRLPSEAQWEYACRAGSNAAYCFGDDTRQLGGYAWYLDSTSGSKGPHPVLMKKPNAFGLYDMHGNVAEWCRDRYDRDFYKKSPRVDPVNTDPYAADEGVNVYRGGSFLFSNACRSAERQSGEVPPQDSLIKHLGFRVIVEIDNPTVVGTTGAKFTSEPGVAKVYTTWPFDSTEAERRQKATAETLGIKPEVTLPLGKSKSEMTFALIPAGEFVMGSPITEKDRREDEVPHKVQITKPFYISTTEVTEAQWLGVTGTSHSLGQRRLNRLPVHKVKWGDAIGFCKTLSQKTGLHIQLPSEAQWEYACRAGSSDAFCFGSNKSGLSSYAAHKPPGAQGVYNAEMKEVAKKEANAFGLYDMHGNAYELCRDHYDAAYYSQSPKADPENKIWKGGRNAPGVMRGGSWMSDPRLCRSASRAVFYRGKRSSAGLRVVFSLPDKTKLASPMFKASPRR